MKPDNTNDNEGWTTVLKKQRKTKNNPEPNTKPMKYTSIWIDKITKKDTTLTAKEQELVEQIKKTHPEINIFCTCCQSSFISDIICRSFFECNKCYCCIGDDPFFDDEEFDENCVSAIGKFCKYNTDYHFTKDKEFYNNAS